MEEHLTDAERQLLVTFLTEAWVRVRMDPDMAEHAAECETLLRRLSGADTRVVCHRAYASQADMLFTEQRALLELITAYGAVRNDITREIHRLTTAYDIVTRQDALVARFKDLVAMPDI
jgi:hypothetical protein